MNHVETKNGVENTAGAGENISTGKTIIGIISAILSLLVAQIAAELLAVPFVLLKVPMGVCNIIAGIAYVGLAYIDIRIFIRKILKLETAALGMPKFRLEFRWIVVALLLPIIVKGIYLLCFSGEYISSNRNGNEIFETLSTGIFFTGIAAGFVEEMVFRGVIMNLLRNKCNDFVAVLFPSLLFGVVHILGMDYSIGGSLLVILAGTMVGIMFSLIAMESGSVWNSGIVHALWNIIIIGGGLYIGNKPNEEAVMTYVLKSKSFAITGGDFGIESSAIALMAYVCVVFVAIVFQKRKHRK